MDINGYRYVMSIAKNQSISKAAEELYLSQPYLSKYLSKLEEELKAPLFNRKKHPICITRAGEEYLKYAKRILAIESEMHLHMENIISGSLGNVAIGMHSSFGFFLLPELLPQFSNVYPHVDVRVIEGKSDELVSLIRGGKVDLGFLYRPFYSNDLEITPIMREEVFLCTNARLAATLELPLPSHGEVVSLREEDYEKLNGQPFILPEQTQGLGLLAENFFDKYKLEPKVLLRIPDIPTLYRLAAVGYGFTITSALCLKNTMPFGDPVFYYLDIPHSHRTWVMAHKKEVVLSEAALYLTDLAKSICENVGK